MRKLGLMNWLGLVAMGLVAPAAAQAPAPPAAAVSAQRPLSPTELDALLAPYAGAPQDALGQVLDAARYPADLMAANAWAKQPAEGRGEANPGWAPTVRTLAERAPRTLDFLAQNIAATAALGSAYQAQPNDVWLAFGRVTLAARQQAQPADDRQPAPTQPAAAPAPAPAAGQAGTAATATAQAPATATATATATAGTTASSTTGTALVAGAIGAAPACYWPRHSTMTMSGTTVPTTAARVMAARATMRTSGQDTPRTGNPIARSHPASARASARNHPASARASARRQQAIASSSGRTRGPTAAARRGRSRGPKAAPSAGPRRRPGSVRPSRSGPRQPSVPPRRPAPPPGPVGPPGRAAPLRRVVGSVPVGQAAPLRHMVGPVPVPRPAGVLRRG